MERFVGDFVWKIILRTSAVVYLKIAEGLAELCLL